MTRELRWMNTGCVGIVGPSRGLGERLWSLISREARMSSIRSFRDLRVWQEASAFYDDVDRLADQLPPNRAGLADQLRRAARSVPANIAEGHSRLSKRDVSRFLQMARGSLHEVESDLISLERRTLVPRELLRAAQVRIPRIERLLAGLIRHLA